MSSEMVAPVHPGEILRTEFMEPMGATVEQLAKRTGIVAHELDELLAGRRALTGYDASGLSCVFGTSIRFWTNLQTRYEMSLRCYEVRNGGSALS